MSKFTPDPSKWIDTSSTSKPRKPTQRPLTSLRYGFATPPPSTILSKRSQPPLEHIRQSTLSGYMTPPTTREKSRLRGGGVGGGDGSPMRGAGSSASKLKRKKDDGEDFFEIYEDRPSLLPRPVHAGPSRKRKTTQSTPSGSSPSSDHAGERVECHISPQGHPPSTSPYVTDRELPSSVMRAHAKLCGQDEDRQKRARSPWATDEQHGRKLELLDAEREAGKMAEREGRRTLGRREVDARVLKGKENTSSGKGLKRVKSLVVLSDDEEGGVKQSPKRKRLDTGSPMPLSPLRKNVMGNRKPQPINSRLSRVQGAERGRSTTRSRSRSRSASPYKPISLEARLMASASASAARLGSENTSRDVNYPIGPDGHYHASQGQGSQERNIRTISASPRWKKTISGSSVYATSPKRNITPQPVLRHTPAPAPAPFPLSLPSDFESLPPQPKPIIAISPLSKIAILPPQAKAQSQSHSPRKATHESFPLSPPSQPESFRSINLNPDPSNPLPTTPTRPHHSQTPKTPHKTPYSQFSPLKHKISPHHKVSPPKSRTPQKGHRQDISETLFALPVPAQPRFVRDEEEGDGVGVGGRGRGGWKAVEMDPETLLTWSLGPRKESGDKEVLADLVEEQVEDEFQHNPSLGMRRESLGVGASLGGKSGRMRSQSLFSETESIAPSMPSQSFPKLFESTPRKRSIINMGPPDIPDVTRRPVTSPRTLVSPVNVSRPNVRTLQHNPGRNESSEKYIGFGNEASSDISVGPNLAPIDRSTSNLFEDDKDDIEEVSNPPPVITPVDKSRGISSGWKHLERGVLSTPNLFTTSNATPLQPGPSTTQKLKSTKRTKKRSRKSDRGSSPSDGTSQARLDQFGIIKEKKMRSRGGRSGIKAFEGEFEDEADLLSNENEDEGVGEGEGGEVGGKGKEAVTSSPTELVTPRVGLRSDKSRGEGSGGGDGNGNGIRKGKGKGRILGKVPEAPYHPKLRAAGIRAMKARESQALTARDDRLKKRTQERQTDGDDDGEGDGSTGDGKRGSSSLIFATSSDDVSSSLHSDDPDLGRGAILGEWWDRRDDEARGRMLDADEDED